MLRNSLKVFSLAFVAGCLIVAVMGVAGGDSAVAEDQSSAEKQGPAEEQALPEGLAKATFAGGCFWCMEPPFDKLDGVISTTSGYTGGRKDNPTYKQVSAGRTGHTEVVQVVFDPTRVTYEELVRVFWRNIDPTVKDRQFCDWGSQYRTGIFYHDDEQKQLAEQSKSEIEASGKFKKVHTEVTSLAKFFPAEGYHQDYYKKNPGHYKAYRHGCGRDRRLKELWGSE